MMPDTVSAVGPIGSIDRKRAYTSILFGVWPRQGWSIRTTQDPLGSLGWSFQGVRTTLSEPPLDNMQESLPSDASHYDGSSCTLSVADGTGPLGPIDLPLRELNENANLEEYTRETAKGEIPKQATSAEGKAEDWKLVTFKVDDPDNPKNWSKPFKWYITMVIAFTCFVVAFASSVVTADLPGVMESFDVSREATMVTITVFVVGFGIGKCWISISQNWTLPC